jgi:hypothetical protein
MVNNVVVLCSCMQRGGGQEREAVHGSQGDGQQRQQAAAGSVCVFGGIESLEGGEMAGGEDGRN